jgi:uncharacterized HAD superfamily protein
MMENDNKNNEVKVSIPIYTNQEIAEIDNVIEQHYSDFMEQISNHVYKERELITLQRIIKYQDEKIKKLECKNVKNKRRC